MPKPGLNRLIGRRGVLPGHLVCEVTDEHLRSLGSGAGLRGGRRTEKLDKMAQSPNGVSSLVTARPGECTAHFPGKPRMLVESARIGIAYVHESRA